MNYMCVSCGEWVDTDRENARESRIKDQRCCVCYAEIHEGLIPRFHSAGANGCGGGRRIIRKADGLS